MIDITKLKMGNRVQFSPKSYGQITNYEIDISNLRREEWEWTYMG